MPNKQEPELEMIVKPLLQIKASCLQGNKRTSRVCKPLFAVLLRSSFRRQPEDARKSPYYALKINTQNFLFSKLLNFFEERLAHFLQFFLSTERKKLENCGLSQNKFHCDRNF